MYMLNDFWWLLSYQPDAKRGQHFKKSQKKRRKLQRRNRKRR